MMGLDNTIWLVYVLAEALLIGLLIYKRAWRILPFFFAYCLWDLLSNWGNFASKHILGSNSFNYVATYLAATVIDSAFQFCILVELAWSVLRPIRSSISQRSLAILAVAVLAVGALIWPFSAPAGLAQYPLLLQLTAHLQQTVSIMRILFFLALAGCSQLLSIGWRDRELQVATGFGLYSLVSLGVAMLQARQIGAEQYSRLNELVIAAFLCSLLYWIFSFAQKEAPRRAFTPQMQSFLLAMAGAARANRSALAESSVAESSLRQK